MPLQIMKYFLDIGICKLVLPKQHKILGLGTEETVGIPSAFSPPAPKLFFIWVASDVDSVGHKELTFFTVLGYEHFNLEPRCGLTQLEMCQLCYVGCVWAGIGIEYHVFKIEE